MPDKPSFDATLKAVVPDRSLSPPLPVSLSPPLPFSPSSASDLGSQLVREMAAAWQQGRPLAADEMLELHAELRGHSEVAVRLVYEEVCQREEAGRPWATQEVLDRYPQWRSELEVLLDCHRLMQSARPPQFPQAGEQLGDFRLVAEIDRGAAGQVFLATQPALCDRPMVLKVTAASGQEHLSLARLQHTYIVPLYLAQEFPDRHLRALCMPYVGGMSLARVLKALQAVPLTQRTGQHLVEALQNSPVDLEASQAVAVQGPAVQFFGRASYVEAVCWIGACLADALQYAHERGLLHLDIKPSNVLLAADGQPMLLDFHLAREPLAARATGIRWLGGTSGYMSNEQQAALDAVRGGRPLPAGVDGRADLYSLGMLLYEALGGPVRTPTKRAPLPRLSTCNAQVSQGLEDLIHKCLADDAEERYSDAASLADDLRRHLAHLPLRQVANRSLSERWHKWRRRRPHTLALTAATVLAAAALAWLAYGSLNRRLEEAELALAHGRRHVQSRAYASAVESFRRGLAAAERLPFGDETAEQLQSELNLARRWLVAADLNRLVDRLRFLHAGEGLSTTRQEELARGCQAIWKARERILPSSAAPLEPAAEEQIRGDLLDLAILWSDLQVNLAPAEKAAARQAALTTLDEAERLVGVSSVLLHHRLKHAQALNLSDLVEETQRRAAKQAPASAWEHYTIGRALLLDERLSEAAAEFRQAVDREPSSFWPQFYRAVCAYRGGEYRDAVEGFSICIALSPQRAQCLYNRALALTALGEPKRAERDYDRCLELDPSLASAALNRGLLHCRQRRYEQADADLRLALRLGADPGQVHYTWGLVYLAQNQRTAALGSIETALAHSPSHAEALLLLERLRAQP